MNEAQLLLAISDWGFHFVFLEIVCGDVLREKLCVDAACVYGFDAMWESCFVTSCCTSFFCRSSPFSFFVDENHLRTICDLKPKKKKNVSKLLFSWEQMITRSVGCCCTSAFPPPLVVALYLSLTS
jgi:hypothetical protein